MAYLPSVAVIYTELIKLAICIGAQGGVCLRTSGERGLTLREEISHQSREILGKSFPMLIPAGLFVMQQVPRLLDPGSIFKGLRTDAAPAAIFRQAELSDQSPVNLTMLGPQH